MRVLVYGSGAVGGYFGACFARGGHDVVFVARGETLAALRQHGLTVELPGDRWHLSPLRAESDPAAAPVADLVLVCVKSYGTASAATALRSAVGPETIVVSLQNGVENEEILARGMGVAPLMVAFTRIGVAMTRPGVVAYSGRGEIVFGEPDGSRSPRALRLATALAEAGIPHRLRADVLVGAWEKLAWNAGFNAVTTLTGTTVAEVVGRPGTREIVVRAMQEVDAVASARGIPVRRQRTQAVLDDSVSGLPDFETSMLQDLRRGRRLEHDAITGAVVRAAAAAGVPVPVNRLLFALLDAVDPGRAPA